MKKFAQLFTQLDQTTKTNAKVYALAQYFAEADDTDKMWTVAILSHRRPKRSVNTTLLRTWAAEFAQIPSWLFEESYHVVGDLAETIALVLPKPKSSSQYSLTYWIDYIRNLKDISEEERKTAVYTAWSQLDKIERFVFNKLITGGFRMGVSQKLMVRALSSYTGIDENKLALRLMGNWTPDTHTFDNLILAENPQEDISRPYPFYLAYALEEKPEALGPTTDWLIERKWDGIRGQLIVREEQLFVWSRGEELVTDKFPEFKPVTTIIPDGTVIDGEIMPYRDGEPLPFALLQTRIGRKNITKKILQNAPVIMIAYDLLEWEGKDIREWPMRERRETLETLLHQYDTKGIILLSEQVKADSWSAYRDIREQSRTFKSEGLMLKHMTSTYKSGRKRGDWWKWKVDPLLVDAVMIYAQSGHGRRANLFTDFTFAVWKGEDLVPFTKAYSGLTDKEFREITSWVRKNTVERFGPVRSVKPVHVFEIAFEGIQRSKRH
ncbi:MAG: ATP-dependent DNA ligase, partial [Saprospiraceae bacterium]|nr:ATP-dependent DNA ligase [Saprospiraceae bacterium]